MEKEKPLGLMAFLGCALTMVSVVLVLVLDIYLGGTSGAMYESQPLANLVGLILLLLGLILAYIGIK
jgi:hypothetical protein